MCTIHNFLYEYIDRYFCHHFLFNATRHVDCVQLHFLYANLIRDALCFTLITYTCTLYTVAYYANTGENHHHHRRVSFLSVFHFNKIETCQQIILSEPTNRLERLFSIMATIIQSISKISKNYSLPSFSEIP